MLRFASGAVGTITSSCVLDRRHDVSLRLVSDSRLLDLRERALSDHELRIETKDGEQAVRHTQDPIAREDAAFVDALRSGSRAVPVPYDEGLRTQAAVCAADLSAQRGGTVVDVAALLAEHTGGRA
jgi:predicted dehydrogenase